MKCYVAAAYGERLTRVRPMLARLREAGVEITHDWTSASAPDCAEKDMDRDVREGLKAEDLVGVSECDVFWLLAPPPGMGTGCWVELGYATSMGKPRVVSGEHADRTIFTEGCLRSRLPPAEDDRKLPPWSDDEALSFILDQAAIEWADQFSVDEEDEMLRLTDMAIWKQTVRKIQLEERAAIVVAIRKADWDGPPEIADIINTAKRELADYIEHGGHEGKK